MPSQKLMFLYTQISALMLSGEHYCNEKPEFSNIGGGKKYISMSLIG